MSVLRAKSLSEMKKPPDAMLEKDGVEIMPEVTRSLAERDDDGV
jgi:hypothetical protein